MNVLLDTCAMLALAAGELPQRATAALACAACTLPPIHKDPFDREIVALAQAHGLAVLTSDENIGRYAGVRTLW